jgi:peptidoglycan/LPS O-acetylase OafA/YrhL
MSLNSDLARQPASWRFLDPFRRITSSGQFIPEIDGLRFLAILSVFIYHLAGDVLRHSSAQDRESLSSSWLFGVTQVLNIGVPLFFIISGFILSTPFAAAHLYQKRPVSLKKYFLRRLTRLEPPYILSLALFFAIKVAVAKAPAWELFPNLMASIFYLHNAIFGAPSVINFVAWSLEIEIQFYILAPALACIFAIRSVFMRRAILVALTLLATQISLLVWKNGALQLSLLGYSQYFLTGFIFADLYLSGGDRRQHNRLWDVVSVIGWPALLALLMHGGVFAYWITPWLILLLYLAAFHGVIMNGFVTNAWIATIGGMCYTIYLLHNYIIAGLGAFTERFLAHSPFEARLLVQFLLMAPVLLALSAIYFRMVERPCMQPQWPRQLMAAIRRLNGRLPWAPVAMSSASGGTPPKG